MAGVVLSDSFSASKAVAECRVVNRRRGNAPLPVGRWRRAVIPSFHCSWVAVLVALDGDASLTVADSRILLFSSADTASRRPRRRALISVRRQVVVLSLRRLRAAAGFVLRGSRFEEPLDPLGHQAALFTFEVV